MYQLDKWCILIAILLQRKMLKKSIKVLNILVISEQSRFKFVFLF